MHRFIDNVLPISGSSITAGYKEIRPVPAGCSQRSFPIRFSGGTGASMLTDCMISALRNQWQNHAFSKKTPLEKRSGRPKIFAPAGEKKLTFPVKHVRIFSTFSKA
jgi:hypothetical protein